jgi:hypothetical protein
MSEMVERSESEGVPTMNEHMLAKATAALIREFTAQSVVAAISAQQMLDFIKRYRDSTECICGFAEKGYTDMPCVHCEAAKLIVRVEMPLPSDSAHLESPAIGTAEKSADPKE